MSFFSIQDFIASGRKSLSNKNYWSALSVALMLPSMCSRIAYEGKQEYFKSGVPRDKKCYVDWCKENFKNSWIRICLGSKFAEVLYELRCDIVHAGCADIYADGKGLYLSLGDNGATDFTKYRIVDVGSLCKSIFDQTDTWCANFGTDSFKYTRVFNSDNRDDRLLYQRLCDEDRADYLKEQFDRENEEKKK